MRPCVVIPCFFRNTDFCDAIRSVASLGYDAVELWGWDGIDPDEAKTVLNETGVELISMCTTEFRLNDPIYRDAFLDGLKKTCEFASVLNVKRIITQVGNDTGDARELQHRSIVEGLTNATPILEKYGITLMIEPLNTLFDHKGYYLSYSAEAFDIIREVGSPFVKVIFDIYHQQITEGNIIPTVISNLPYIAHLHGAGHPGRHELWLGENDYRVIIDAIDKAGYTGAIGLEYFPIENPIESLRKAHEIFE
ncbi:MAG: TIM barrel protein [Clostridia bacterium]|nr:TIM barrel protein [Clostridia bacterium]